MSMELYGLANSNEERIHHGFGGFGHGGFGFGGPGIGRPGLVLVVRDWCRLAGKEPVVFDGSIWIWVWISIYGIPISFTLTYYY